jgi:hypothetical protein
MFKDGDRETKKSHRLQPANHLALGHTSMTLLDDADKSSAGGEAPTGWGVKGG